jgi:hypothetical protein
VLKLLAAMSEWILSEYSFKFIITIVIDKIICNTCHKAYVGQTSSE